MNALKDKHIILGVTGSIAVYKAVDLASKLHQNGVLVDVILTEAAARFVSPLTFQSVTGRKAYQDEDLWSSEDHVAHISLGKSADLMVVAPVTANTIFKLAHGEAGNLLTLTALAATCPLLIAPAMDGGMYQHPATQANLAILQQRGAAVIGPESGHLASGLRQIGRMTEPTQLLGHIRTLLGREGPLSGKKVLVTAASTHEPLDPVRFIGNRSSGKQGFALARAALDLGAEVILITGPATLQTPAGAARIDVNTAQDMLQAVTDHIADTHVLLMAAAVSDFRPKKYVEQKIKKGDKPSAIELDSTPDVLKEIAAYKAKKGFPSVTVGFAAESQDLLANAAKKLKEKKLDLIVANDITASDAGFAVDTNRVVLLSDSGKQQELPLLSKEQVAEEVLSRVVDLLSGKQSSPSKRK